MRMFLSVLVWSFGALFGFMADILNYPLSLFVVWFANQEGYLPRWLWWFQTPTNPLDGGEDYRENYRWFRNHPKVDEGWRRKLNQIWWMWRNPMYGLQNALGKTVVDASKYMVSGNELVGDKTGEGRVYRKIDDQFLPIWQYYNILVWWGGKLCVRINLGYKIWANPKNGQTCMLVMSFNPWKSFTGKRATELSAMGD